VLRRQLSEEEVLRWFQNMDFEVPHTRVPVDGYDPTHGAGPQLPDVSFVQYNYSMHIVEVDRTVVKTVQRALDLYKCARPPSLPPLHRTTLVWHVSRERLCCFSNPERCR
jgi:hypothetical protein